VSKGSMAALKSQQGTPCIANDKEYPSTADQSGIRHEFGTAALDCNKAIQGEKSNPGTPHWSDLSVRQAPVSLRLDCVSCAGASARVALRCAKVSPAATRSQWATLTKDRFKCLVYLSGGFTRQLGRGMSWWAASLLNVPSKSMITKAR
jgi:hypothetical protein